jgi:hypothetical protein
MDLPEMGIDGEDLQAFLKGQGSYDQVRKWNCYDGK